MIAISIAQAASDAQAVGDDWIQLPIAGGAVAGIIGLVEIAKRTGMPSRFGGLMAVALALAFTAFGSWPDLDDGDVLRAVLMGLAAAGAYSQTKALAGSPQPEAEEVPRDAGH